ncbi:MAG: M20 family metallopeptidase [Bacteroidales bacterium]|nr:M20 family metallopeptidase [Syntrophaceticus sp.]MDD3315601.1 M20 family metallopeptidase [Syntrophaceticus sp.]MDD4430253.1 M20 family metallopeptidase [Bacteroidales bacterium]
MNNIQHLLEEKKTSILELEKFLYNNPEVEMNEYKAKAKFIELLEKENFCIEEDIPNLPTAFVAYKSRGNGPAIGILAEYDALPGIGHACGHNLIGAIGYGTAVVIAEMLSEHEGSIYILGSPAEETGKGKTGLIDAGYFNKIDIAMMVHPMNLTGLKTNMTNLEGYDVTFKGKSSHAGQTPEKGVNALDAAVQFYCGIGMLRQQIEDCSRIHAIITKGGDAPNIIPDIATVRLEIRHEEINYFKSLVERVLNVAKGAAIATGCSVNIEMFEPQICCMKNNNVMSDLFKKHLIESGVDGKEIIDTLIKAGGCSDMGNVSQLVPSIHPWIQMARSTSELHTTEFLEDADSPFALNEMFRAIGCLAGVGVDVLKDPGLLSEIKKDFENGNDQ